MATVSLLGDVKRISRASRLEREGIVTLYGHSKVNFMRAPLAPGDHTLRVAALGGAVKLRVPDDVGIQIDGVIIYSDIRIETLATGHEERTGGTWSSSNFERAAVRVRIQTVALFGEIEIMRVPVGAAADGIAERSYEGATRPLNGP